MRKKLLELTTKFIRSYDTNYAVLRGSLMSTIASNQHAVKRSPFSTTSNAEQNTTQQQQLHLRLTANATRNHDLHAARVIDKHYLSPTVVQLVLQLDDDNKALLNPPPTNACTTIHNDNFNNKAEYRAGQWVDLHIPNEKVVGGFSIVSAPLETQQTGGKLRLAVKYTEHPPAMWCHSDKCCPGSQVQLRVGGDFYFSPEKAASTMQQTTNMAATTNESQQQLRQRQQQQHAAISLLLIAGGVGINPIISIYQHFLNLKLTATSNDDNKNVLIPKMHKLCLLYSAQTVDDLIFRHDIEKGRSLGYPDVECKYFCTRLPLTTTSSYVVHCDSVLLETGDAVNRNRIEKSDIERALEFLTTSPKRNLTAWHHSPELMCYVCGPKEFMESMVNLVKLYPSAIRSENVQFEKWW